MATFTIFGNLSATMGTVLFTQNTLLMQIGQMSVYFTNGLGYAVETLSGNFKGQGEKEKFIPLVRVSVASSLLVGFSFAAACVFFPQNIFGLLTNHTEITSDINTYAWGLIFLLAFSSASTMLEGYFLGLAQGDIIRNVSSIATVVGFAPSAIAAWYFHNNHILWLSVSLFLFAKTALLAVYLAKSLSSDANTEPVSGAPVGN
ncbi:MATE family efflux transporter [Microcoleus sp. A003_D6]|uniref:MATE family efflux transporter n=1 Tax=Microcoleus sp. A003_D6 TaxID=3055266 RepID=UPI002FD263C8